MAEDEAEKTVLMYEEMFADRYTETDPDYEKTVSSPIPHPPCVTGYFVRSYGRSGRGRGNWDNRGGRNWDNRGGGNWDNRGGRNWDNRGQGQRDGNRYGRQDYGHQGQDRDRDRQYNRDNRNQRY